MTPLTHPGHRRFHDGSVIRLDCERGRWVGTHYQPDLSVRACFTGDLSAVQEVIGQWMSLVMKGSGAAS
jgi:hypothetical protein